MKAVIMAGGEGTRLRPLTINRPKPMVTMVDRQAIHHIIELLKIHGITDVIITVQYLANFIQDYYSDGSNYGVNITYSVEHTPLGTAGSVKNAEYMLSSEPFLVISGDALTDIDLTAVIQSHLRSGAMATLALKHVPNPLDFGVVITDGEQSVRQFLEKPTWGEVFSDTVNTGIYVLSPDVFRYVPPNISVDWSRDVFPHMLRDNQFIHGCVVEGYWTDVGTIDEYMRACGDYLKGLVQLPRIGRDLGGGIWAQDDADIAPDAQLYGPIFLGHGTRIRSGAHIHGPAVVGNYTIIDPHARIDRSIIWRNSYIGERAELRGAIVLRQCDIRSQVRLFEGVVIGDGVQIGNDAVVQPNVKIWPSKEIDEGATVTSSLIWGSQARRVLFGRHGVRGLVNVEVTPEFCARVGAAYGAVLERGSNVTINRDPHFTPRMLKRALIAGLPSTGVHVWDLQAVPIPVARIYTYANGAAGGVHVRLSPTDNRMVDIKFFDQRGLDLNTATERKIESVFFREDFRRAYLDEIGRISYGENVGEVYIEAFLSALRLDTIETMVQVERNAHHPHLIIDYANANDSSVYPRILQRLRFDVVELNANLDENRIVQDAAEVESEIYQLSQITPVLQARIGIRLTSGGERVVIVDNSGQRVTGMRALAAMAALSWQTHGGGTIAVPVTAPSIFEQLADKYGGKVIRIRQHLRALMQTAAAQRDLLLLGDGIGAYIFPSFYPIADGMFAAVKLLELITLNNTTLSEVVRALPDYYLTRTRVPCRWESKGTVMRKLHERYPDRPAHQAEGVRVDMGAEWVLILPDPDSPFFHIYAEGQSEERARQLSEQFAALVADMQ